MDSASALQALNSFQPTSSADLLSQAQTKYGIPDLSSRVQALTGITNNLTNSIAAVDPSVTGRTQGTFTTEAQRGALVNREKQPLLTNLNSNNQSLNFARGDLSTNQSMADRLATSLAQDQTSKYSRLKSQYDISKAAEDKRAADALAQQKMAEQERQFNIKSSQNQQKINKSGPASSSSANATPQDIIKYFVSAPSQYGDYNPGSTNYHRWQAAEQALQQAGFNPGAANIKKLTTAAFGSPSERSALGV